MPLSEQEQRLLDEMERSLYQNDADFVATVGAERARPSYGTMVLGSLLVLAGVGGLIAGVASQLLVVGVIGFAVMFVGVVLFVAPPRRAQRVSGATGSGASGQQRAQRQASFMDNLNDRWDKRAEGQ